MAEVEPRRALGRGLAALIGDANNEVSVIERARTQRRIPIEFLRRNPRNPRTSFTPDDLDELTSSVREKGIVQPILVRPVPNEANAYEIIAGERRWRAAQAVGLHEVPVLIHAVSDREALELAIVENVQRADLNALEEANGYQRLMDEFGYTQAALGDVIGKSRPHIANTLRLLKLPETVQGFVRDGKLSAGHARALIGSDDPEGAALRIIEGGLSVRDAEAIADKPKRGKGASSRSGGRKDADTAAMEKRLADALGLTVVIKHGAGESGELRIQYTTADQLEEVARRLSGG
ncbi:MAG: ParB/RepB/Spo0J family partition protein [Bauldia sp.]|nr:ParB/RepB/Spo0J family partition protein [Bauldia sp.]